MKGFLNTNLFRKETLHSTRYVFRAKVKTPAIFFELINSLNVTTGGQGLTRVSSAFQSPQGGHPAVRKCQSSISQCSTVALETWGPIVSMMLLLIRHINYMCTRDIYSCIGCIGYSLMDTQQLPHDQQFYSTSPSRLDRSVH